MDLRKAIVLSRSKEAPAPIMTHLEAQLSSDSYDLHLRTHTSHKDILEAHLVAADCHLLSPGLHACVALRGHF